MSEVLEAQAPTDTEIYERILEAVLDHRLEPGTRLGEEKLGRAFGVSRTRIRQVLVRLAAEQVVVLAHNRGASVACPTPQEAREVFDARMLIEPPLVEAFVGHAGSREFAALARLLRDEDQARRGGNRRAAIRLSGEFHLAIAEGARNATLEKILRELVSRTSLILMTYEAPREEAGPGCGCSDHEALLAAMQTGDARSAKRLMKKHLDHLLAQLSFAREPGGAPDVEALFRIGR